MQRLESALAAFSSFAWGTPLLVLLLGGGAFFLLLSRFLPFRYLGHAVNVLRGKYDDPDDPGDINHYEALATALAATVGMGNISGVAVAITMGGPGAVFWMWMSALLGMATKFFTCTLAVMFRGKDSLGRVQGGPMYVIVEGLGKKWKPLAVFFSLAGLIGCLPMFQANQLTQTLQDVILTPAGILDSWQVRTWVGVGITALVSLVIFGGIRRIGSVAGKMVPFMVAVYELMVIGIIVMNYTVVPEALALIFRDAFTAEATMGGMLGELIRTGAKRAAFSNEAGIGTAPMAHGAAKTQEPVREGLVAMLGPAIDTLVVCTMTALAIIITGTWQEKGAEGITVTIHAFEQVMGTAGPFLLMLCVLVFSLTTLFSYSYYGTKCLGFLIGADKQGYYNYFYVASIVLGAVISIDAVINLIDGMFALMAFPTMLSALLLSGKVRAAAKDYFGRMRKER